MVKYEKKSFQIFLFSICILLLSLFIVSNFDDKGIAFSPNDTSSYIAVDEIWNSSSKKFNKENFNNLINLLAGSEQTSLSTIDSMAASQRNSADFRSNNAEGKDIVVKLGGFNWTATYLSKDKNNNTILTLWLTDATQLANKYCFTGSFGTVNNFSATGGMKWWGARYENGEPCSIYGDSIMSVAVLNNGGIYNLIGMDIDYQPIPDNPFAQFTINTSGVDLYDFIVTPEYILWQESQSAVATFGTSYLFPNDAWGSATGSYHADITYTSSARYSDWKDDKLWLPSVTEVGYRPLIGDDFVGLWNLSDAQRETNQNSPDATSAPTGVAWLRSGSDNNNSKVSAIISLLGIELTGSYDPVFDDSDDADPWVVRPALHLNLTEAAKTIDHTVTIDKNGGSGGTDSFTINYLGQMPTITLPTREGFTINGVYDQQNNKIYEVTESFEAKIVSGQEIYRYIQDTTLIAQWTAQNLKANFNYNGGTVVRESDSQYYSSNGTFLSGIPTDDEMSKTGYTGYTFKGWSLTPNNTGVYYDSTTDWNDITVTTTNGKGSCSVSDENVGNIEFTLYAIWEANKYSVTLDQQGGKGGTTSITATYDSAMPSITIPSKFGHTFNGYFDKVSDGTKYYNADGTSAKNWDKDSTATLYAQWTPYSYTLTLNGNGGTTKTGQQTITQSGSYASTLTLDSKPFIQKGYIFKGWSTTKDGAVKYLDGANYSSLITSNNTSITLYAQWEETWANHASSSLETTEINGVTYNVIASAEDLAYLSKQSISSTLLGKYIQTADIDLSDYTWLPIGSENAFCGEYLGQGHKITGLKTCDAVDANGVYLQTFGGLFGKLGKNSTTGASANIVGVYITDCLVYGQYSGAIAGLSDDDSVNIEACILENIEIEGNTTASFVGSSSGGQIKDCLLISSNISTANATTRGFYTGTMTIKSCYFVENNSATRFTGESSDYSNWIEDVFVYPLPSIIVWFPNN